MSAAGSARTTAEPSTDRRSQTPRVIQMARTRPTRVLGMLEEIVQRYDAGHIAREDGALPRAPFDPRQLRLNAGLTRSAPRPDPLTQRGKLTAASTRSDLRASLAAAVVPAGLSGARRER
jgi:hypothetical protein